MFIFILPFRHSFSQYEGGNIEREEEKLLRKKIDGKNEPTLVIQFTVHQPLSFFGFFLTIIVGRWWAAEKRKLNLKGALMELSNEREF